MFSAPAAKLAASAASMDLGDWGRYYEQQAGINDFVCSLAWRPTETELPFWHFFPAGKRPRSPVHSHTKEQVSRAVTAAKERVSLLAARGFTDPLEFILA